MEGTDKKAENFNSSFMLREYERLDSLKKHEVSQAEHRVDFFLTVASAAVGAVAFLFQIPSSSTYDRCIAAQTILIILLPFGLTTLNRLNARNAHLKALSVAMTRIQDYFAKKDPEVAVYLDTIREVAQKPPSGIAATVLRRLHGTLTDLIVLGNSLIVGGIIVTALLSKGYNPSIVVMWTVMSVIASAILQYAYHHYMEVKLFPFQYSL